MDGPASQPAAIAAGWVSWHWQGQRIITGVLDRRRRPAAASACTAHVGCPPRGGFQGPCWAAPAEIPSAPPPAGSDK